MRYLISILFILFSTLLKAQVPEQYLGSTNNRVVVRGQLLADSLFFLPQRSDTNFSPGRAGAIIYRLADNRIYLYTGTYWTNYIKTIYSADDTVRDNRTVEQNNHTLTFTGGSFYVQSQANDISLQNNQGAVNLLTGLQLSGNNGEKEIALRSGVGATDGIRIIDETDSVGLIGNNLSTTKIKANDTAYARMREVKSTIHDSSGNYIKNDTTITQNGGFKMGPGNRVWLDSTRATTLYLGNSSNFNNTLVRASNIYSINDTLNPINSKRAITAQCRTGFTSPPPSVYFSYGGTFEAIIKAENNQNWNSQIHPVISGVSSQVFSLSGATGIIPKASSYYGTAAINTGLTVDELNLIDITYQHTGTINHSNGIRIADIDAGVNGIGIYNVLGDGLASPAGRYFLFDSTSYPSHFAGGIETRGLDNYLENIASSYTARSKPDKNYIDSLVAAALAGETLNSVTTRGASTANNISTGIISAAELNSSSNVTGTLATFSTATKTPLLVGTGGSGTNLTLQSTLSGTKGKILFGTSAYDEANNRMGIGTTSPSYTLDITGKGRFTDTAIAANFYTSTTNVSAVNFTGITSSPILSFTSGAIANTQKAAAFTLTVNSANTQNLTNVNNAVSSNTFSITSGATGSITSIYGINNIISNASSGATISNAYLYKGNVANSGTMTNSFGQLLYGLGAATNNTGLFLSASSSLPSAASGNYGIYDATGYSSYLAGNLGIGQTTPTARLHIPAGTATASTAPLKFTSGTNLTTTEAGAIEYDGSHLYFTATNAGTRYQLDQQTGTTYTFSTGLTNTSGTVTNNLSTGVSGGQVLIGSTSTTSGITYKTTTGVGSTGADHIFVVGNNGATEAMRINNAARVGIGVNSSTGWLSIQAGTTSVAPLVLNPGTNISGVQDGAIEYNGTNYFASVNTTRYTLAKTLTNTATLDFGSTAGGAVTDLTVTVTGCGVGDVVSIGVPNGSVPAGGTFFGWVSATNTVTLRFANNSSITSYDPPSGTYRISVTQY